MVLTTDSIPEVKGKTSEKPEVNDPKGHAIPEETPARIKIVQKYKRGLDGALAPEKHVTITYNYIGKGKGGQFRVPRATLETFWKAMQ